MFWARIRSLFRGARNRHRMELEMSDELQFHVESRADDLMSRHGLSRAEALRQARIEFGGVEKYKEEGREARGLWLFDKLRADFRYTGRRLAANPAFTFTVVATLALGIGINTAVFSILDAILFRPVPYVEAGRLAGLMTYYADGKFYTAGRFGPALVEEWRRQTDLFDRVEASEPRSFTYEDEQGAELVSGSFVTPGLISILGVRPLAGRLFVDGDGRGGTDRIVIIGERFWNDRLGRDPQAVGKQIVLDDGRFEIVGIMARTFRYPNESQDLWIPYDVGQPPPPLDSSWTPSFQPLARMQPRLQWDQVNERVEARGAELNAAAGQGGKDSAALMQLGQVFNEQTKRSLAVLGGAVVFLLLVVCANVANLTLARSMSGVRDRAVRTALGASRRDLVREAFVEYAVLGMAGAGLALIVARTAIGTTVALLPEAMTFSSLNAIDLDARAMICLASISAITVFLFGTPPVLLSSSRNTMDGLKGTPRFSTGSTFSRRLRPALVIAEVALSLVLLVGAALMTRTLMKLQATDLGLDPTGLLTLRLGMPVPGYSSPPAREVFLSDLLERLRATPGVDNASVGFMPPGESAVVIGSLEFSDRPGEPSKPAFSRVYEVFPGFFATTGIRILEGRDFREREIGGAAIISEEFAKTYWPGRSAVGMRFHVADTTTWQTIIGVVGEVRGMGEERNRPEIYYPHGHANDVLRVTRPSSRIAEYENVVIRAPEPDSVIPQLAGIVHSIDSRVVVSQVRLVEQQFADAIARPRVLFLMLVVFAGFGLVLAAAGLYGVLSYLVSQRMREIGIRLTLGATPREMGRMVFRSGLRLSLIGIALGLGASYWLVRTMETLLYEIEPRDPVSITVVSIVLLATAILAAWRPVRRDMRADPGTLLREE